MVVRSRHLQRHIYDEDAFGLKHLREIAEGGGLVGLGRSSGGLRGIVWVKMMVFDPC